MRSLHAILVLTILLAGGFGARGELVNGVKAVVHDAVITYQEVFDRVTPLVQELNARYWNNPETLSRERVRLLDENTETLVERELILREFESSGLQIPEAVIDDYIGDTIHERYNGSRALMTRDLQARGMTFEKFRQQIREQFIVSQMQLRHVSDALIISPHKMEAYYASHTNDFNIEDQVKLRMITLNKTQDDEDRARRIAEEILTKLKEGATFAEMASVYSQDSRRAQGGSWDWERTSVLRQEFKDAVATLEPGQNSGIIDAPEACYILQLEERKNAHVRPLSEVRQEIEGILKRAEQQRLRDQWIQRLKKKTFVRYF